jgi:hypothetical protein
LGNHCSAFSQLSGTREQYSKNGYYTEQAMYACIIQNCRHKNPYVLTNCRSLLKPIDNSDKYGRLGESFIEKIYHMFA